VRLGHSGLVVSRLAFGTWQLGGDRGPTDTAAAMSAIRRADDEVMQRIDHLMADAVPVAGPSPERM
jgi:aryl-alcohol dehydrogenase-like predicted oxidoreductase